MSGEGQKLRAGMTEEAHARVVKTINALGDCCDGWQKRCELAESELSCLREDNERLRKQAATLAVLLRARSSNKEWAVLGEEYDRLLVELSSLRAENERLREIAKEVIAIGQPYLEDCDIIGMKDGGWKAKKPKLSQWLSICSKAAKWKASLSAARKGS